MPTRILQNEGMEIDDQDNVNGDFSEIIEEIGDDSVKEEQKAKFIRSLTGRVKTKKDELEQFFLHEGKDMFDIMYNNKVLPRVSSMLCKAGAKAEDAFKGLYVLLFDEHGNKTKYLKNLDAKGIDLSRMSSILKESGAKAASAFENLYNLWFDERGEKTKYLQNLENEGVDLARMSSILHGVGAKAKDAFIDLYGLWFNERGEKTKYLKSLEKAKIDLIRMSSILSGSGAKAKDAFIDLYNLWFDEQGEKTKYLQNLENEGVDLARMSGILSRSGAKVASAFIDLYGLWFNKQGEKTKYLQNLEKAKVDLVRMSSILSGSGAQAASAFEDLYNLWFNEQGEKTKYLKSLENEGVDLARMSGILSGSGAKAKKAFIDLYGLWFNEQGEKTKYLKSLENEGVNLVRMSGILSGSGSNAKKAFIDLYGLWFNERGEKTKYLKSLEKAKIDLVRMSSILSGSGSNAKKSFEALYNLWFNEQGEKTKYLQNLEKAKVDLASVSSILDGTGSNAKKAFIDLYGLWFNERGEKTKYLKSLENEGVDLARMSSILHKVGTKAKDAFEALYNLWFDERGEKTKYLQNLENEGVDLARMSSILSGAGSNAKKSFEDLYNLWFNERGEKTKYLQNLEKAKVGLVSMSSILGGAGSNAKKSFEDLYNLWFNEQGEKTKYLQNLEKAKVDLVSMSSILNGVGAGAKKSFEDLYNLWFDEQGRKTKYLQNLESEGVDLASMSSILGGAGSNAKKSFEDLYNLWFDEQGRKTKYLQNLEKAKVDLTRMSSILQRARAKAKDAFIDLYNLWFDERGEKTKYLKNLEKAKVDLARMSNILKESGAAAASAFEDLYNLWFDERGEKTKYLKNLENEGVDLARMSGILSGSGSNAKKAFIDLYGLWFNEQGEKTKYLKNLEKAKVDLANVSLILSGSGAGAKKSFEDLYNLWFDERGEKTKYLKNLEKTKIDLARISGILSGSGAGAKKSFEGLYNLWFDERGEKTKYLKNLEKAKVDLASVSSILNGVGAKAKDAFEDLYNLWFDERGEKTKYLKNLEKAKVDLASVSSILHRARTKAKDAFIDLYNLWFDERGEKTKYLQNLENEGVDLASVSSILSGSGAKAKDTFEDLYNLWFDEQGRKTKYLQNLEKAKVDLARMSSILNGSGAKAKNAFIDLYNLWFDERGEKTKYLQNLEKAKVDLASMSSILSGSGAKAKNAFIDLYNLWFDERGEKTKYLKDLDKKMIPLSRVSHLLNSSGAKGASAFKDLYNLWFDEYGEETEHLRDLEEEIELESLEQEQVSENLAMRQQCSEVGSSASKRARMERSTHMSCVDSRNEEKITEEEKEQYLKDFYGVETHEKEIITIDSPQVSFDGGKVNIRFKDNNGDDKEFTMDGAEGVKDRENYVLGSEIMFKGTQGTEYSIIEKIKGQDSEYYLKIDNYGIKIDNIIQGEDNKKQVLEKLGRLSDRKQVLEEKKYIEDIAHIQDYDHSDIEDKIKQDLLEKGVNKEILDSFKSYCDDYNEKVSEGYISNVAKNLREEGIAFDDDKFNSAKVKVVKGGRFFSLMAIYDLIDSTAEIQTLGRHDSDGLKQLFGINGILDAMDDVRTSINISPNSKVGILMSGIPQSARQAFVGLISNPIVKSITFATIAYQFGYSVDEIIKGNHHPLNYYWTASSGVKLASMGMRPTSVVVSFTIKSVRLATNALRGLSVAGKVLGRLSVATMVADVIVTVGTKIYERMEHVREIAEQIPLLPGYEQESVFFGIKDYQGAIEVKGYLNQKKENAIKLLDENYNVAAVVQYLTSIEEEYSEVIKAREEITDIQIELGTIQSRKWTCNVEKRYDHIYLNRIDAVSNVKNDLSGLIIPVMSYYMMHPFFLVKDVNSYCGVTDSIVALIKNDDECYRDLQSRKVYIVNTDEKHIPHLTRHQYENLGLRIIRAPSREPIKKSQCSAIINAIEEDNNTGIPCNVGKIHRECSANFTLSGEPFIMTNLNRKDSADAKKQNFPKNSILYLSGPKTLTAAANYPAVMYVPEGKNTHYIGSKNDETIFIINNISISGTLEGGVGKENTLIMNVTANRIGVDLYHQDIEYSSKGNTYNGAYVIDGIIRLNNTYNYVSYSDSNQRERVVTHCKTRFVNAKDAEVLQNHHLCEDSEDYEVRVVNKENLHHRGLKKAIFVVNEDSDNAEIIWGDTGKIKENMDVMDVRVSNITRLRVNKNPGEIFYRVGLLDEHTDNVIASVKVSDFKNLIIQVKRPGITESVIIEEKSLFDTVEDIMYQKLGNDVDKKFIEGSEKKLKASIQVSVQDVDCSGNCSSIKDIANSNNLGAPISKIEIVKNYGGVPTEKVIIVGMYSSKTDIDFSNNHFAKNYKNKEENDYQHYMAECDHYQDVVVKGREEKDHYVIKLPKRNNTLKPESLTRLNLRIKNKAMLYQNTPDDIIDFAELNVTDTSSINIKKGKRNYMNKCHNRTISDLTEESLEIQNITILSNEGIKWSLSIGLVHYFIAPEYQCIVLRMNNKFYKINNYDLELEEVNYNSVNYHKPDQGGLQIYHNQPNNHNNVGLVDLKDKSILNCDMKIVNNSLLLSYKNNTLVKVENWGSYLPARKMRFAFYETIIVPNNYNPEDIITKFNTIKKVLLQKEQVFNSEEIPVQHKHRHHHRLDRGRRHLLSKHLGIDSSNQPEIAASSSTRQHSWINGLFDWVKSSVSGLLSSKPTLSNETSSTSSPISQVDVPVDVNGTIMLLDVLVRKITGQKYISVVDQFISPLEAQGYALNITKRFKEVVEQAAKGSQISMHRLNIDFVEIQKEVTGKIMSGKMNEIPGILNSYVEKACPDREAGCPGKLSPRKYDKFMVEFNSRLDIALDQSIQQILNNEKNTLEVNHLKEQQEPKSYLNGTFVQGHLNRNKVSLIL